MALSFFLPYDVCMETPRKSTADIETMLRERFEAGETAPERVPSTAFEAPTSRKEDLLLSDGQRGKMPFTKDKYLVKEQPELVMWERETRKFLRNLSPQHGHRVSAAMIYEWATGIKVADLVAEGGSTVDLKRINKVLRFYFGKPYMTYIMGRKVPNAFTVRPGYYIRRHRPMTLTLYAEYSEGTLYP